MTEGPQDQPAAGNPATGNVYLYIRASSEEEREALQAWLAEQRLDPQVVFITSSLVSFELNTSDDSAVSELMRSRPDIGWTVVPPGQPPYLLSSLDVQGPDGRSFRFSDVPAATTVATLAEETIAQYPESGMPGRPTVVERVHPTGEIRRVNPDTTLHEEGVTDGDRLRVGFQVTAG